MPHTSKMLICLLALLSLPWLNACNTARGMGQDIQAVGRAMSGTAQDVEEGITGEPDTPARAETPTTPEAPSR